MKSLVSVLILFVVIFQDVYAQKPHQYIDPSIKVDTNNIPLRPDQYYFPASLFPVVKMVLKEASKTGITLTPKKLENTIDTLRLDWYSRFLYAMQEPLLFNKPLSKTIYRFTWLRTFENPVVIRVEKDAAGAFVYWKMTNGQGGYEPDSLVVSKKRKLTEAEWNKLAKSFQAADFWHIERNGTFGDDGSHWILEGADFSKYHVADSQSPRKGSYFHNIGNYLLTLTDLKIKEEKIY